jgi:hypothetical protein
MWLTLTLLLIAIVVLGLAAYLIAVAIALLDARRHVARIADALESVARDTLSLEEKLVTINGALSALADGLQQADRHLGRTARVYGL